MRQIILIKQEYENTARGNSSQLFRTVLSFGDEIGLDRALAYLANCVIEKRLAWLDRNPKRLDQTGDPVLDGYRLFFRELFGPFDSGGWGSRRTHPGEDGNQGETAGSLIIYRDPEAWMAQHDVVGPWAEYQRFYQTIRLVGLRFLGNFPAEIRNWLDERGLSYEYLGPLAAGFERS